MITWQSSAGRLTLLPERGRMLQAEVGGHSAFWVNPNPGDTWNVGGDRLWCAPESDWNWKTLGPFDFTQYEVPAAMDPGEWKITEESEDRCTMEMLARLRHQHRATDVTVRVTRSFERFAATTPQTLAFRTENLLEIVGGTPGQWVGIWGLIQLPAGGWLQVATHGHAAFRDYFSPTPAHHWQQQENAVVFHLTGDCQFKAGFLPENVTGRLTYDRAVSCGRLRIERQAAILPWRHYADRPLGATNPQGATTPQGDAIQLYNDGGEFGGFGEMEYHTPALQVGNGPQVLTDSILTTIRLLAES